MAEYEVKNQNQDDYVPPVQSNVGQIFDSLFLLFLVYVVLLVPVMTGMTAGTTVTTLPDGTDVAEITEEMAAGLTWESLGQNHDMVAQWEQLDVGIQGAAQLILTHFKYEIVPGTLIFTALIIIGYFFLVIKLSRREYQDVINEKFGRRDNL